MALVAAGKAGNRRPLERVCIPFLYLLPTGKHPFRCHQNRVFREKRDHCRGVILVVRLLQLLVKRIELSKCVRNPKEITLLGYSWFGSTFLLGKGWRSKSDCQPY
jgi:hypothetical protein